MVQSMFARKYGGGFKYGHLQRKVHALIGEKFDSKQDGYKWLKTNFKIDHLSEVKDRQTLMEIWAKLILVPDPL